MAEHVVLKAVIVDKAAGGEFEFEFDKTNQEMEINALIEENLDLYRRRFDWIDKS